MSTVILTPTHMACDHTIIHKSYPHHSRVDIGYSKIFMPKDKIYLVGTVGEFDPKEIDTSDTYKAVTHLLLHAIALQIENQLVGDLCLFGGNPAANDYTNIFDISGRTIVATKNYRFLFQYSAAHKMLVAKRCGPYAGIGSGGPVAAGLLMGKMPLKDIWEPLNAMDHQSSAEHTSIPLSVLRKNRMNL